MNWFKRGVCYISDVFQDLKKYAHQLVDSGLAVGAGGNLSGRYVYFSK